MGKEDRRYTTLECQWALGAHDAVSWWVNCHLLITPTWRLHSLEMCAACPLKVNGLGDDSDLIYLPLLISFSFFFFP